MWVGSKTSLRRCWLEEVMKVQEGHIPAYLVVPTAAGRMGITPDGWNT